MSISYIYEVVHGTLFSTYFTKHSSSSSECTSGTCRTACCGTKGKSTGCTDCDNDGDCSTCSAGYYKSSYQCYACGSGKTSPSGSTSSSSCVSNTNTKQACLDLAGSNAETDLCTCLDIAGGDAAKIDSCNQANSQADTTQETKSDGASNINTPSGSTGTTSNGGSCDLNSDCSSGICRGSNCCGTKGRSEGCKKF